MQIGIVKRFVFTLLILATSIVSGMQDAWPNFPVPKNSRAVVVAGDMVFNGVPMKCWELTALISPEELEAFYISAWQGTAENSKAGAPGHQILQMANMIIISRIEGDYLLTVQINKNAKSSKAYLAISKITGKGGNDFILGEGFPALTGTTFINDIKAVDGTKVSRTIVATSDAPLTAVVGFYRSSLSTEGWIESTGNIKVEARGLALMFTKMNKEMNIALVSGKGTVNIIAVQVEN